MTPVGRGTVWPPKVQRVESPRFGYLESNVASFEDVYAGKICAALDRQHPRDLFDIKELLANEGISRKLFITFLAYLLTSDRPMSEILMPERKDILSKYETELREMVQGPSSLEELAEARGQLVRTIHSVMTDDDRAFLMSVKEMRPDWSLVRGLPRIEHLPAVQWKLQNLDEMSKTKHDASVRKLAAVLELARSGVRSEEPNA